MSAIHSTAIIDSDVELGESISIGPYAVLEGKIRLGDRCRVEAHGQIRGRVTLGADNLVGSGAVIGGPGQVLGGDPDGGGGVLAGDGNVFREQVTVNRSADADGTTRLGSRNYLMAGAHLGHDVCMGDDNTVANSVLFGGHVLMGSHCFIGGGSAFHQFVQVGDGCIIRGLSAFSVDVPPFVIGVETNRVAGLNSVGMRRRGVSRTARRELRILFSLFYRDGLTGSEALAQAGERVWESEEAGVFLRAFRDPSRKGVCLRFRG